MGISRIHFRAGSLVAIGMMILYGGEFARAGVMYTFAGPNFDTFDGNSNGLTTSNSITGVLDFSNALAANFNSAFNTLPTLLDWSFTDGIHTLSSASGNAFNLYDLLTDDNGNIDGWRLDASVAPGNDNPLFLLDSDTRCGLNDGIAEPGPSCIEVSSHVEVGTAWYSGSAPFGTWTTSGVSVAPEPSGVMLAISGLVGMIVWKRRRSAHLIALFITFFAGTAHRADAGMITATSFTGLGFLPGGTLSYPNGINAAGQIVGFANNAAGNYDAFSYSGGLMTDIGPPGGTGTYATGINDSGQITGYGSNASSATHAFSFSGGVMTDLGTLGGSISYGQAINDLGQIAGYGPDSTDHDQAFIYSGGVLTEIGTLGGAESGAFGINSAGTIVGGSTNTAGVQHAFSYSAGVMTDLGTLAGDTYSAAYGVNDEGQVVGYSANSAGNYHAFSYSGGVMTDLGTFGGAYNGAFGVNSAGEIVGYSFTAGGQSDAFLYYGGALIDLNSLLPSNSGWILSTANAINASGQIVGYGTDPQGKFEAFLMDTQMAPEPGTLALIAIGSALLGLIHTGNLRPVRWRQPLPNEVPSPHHIS